MMSTSLAENVVNILKSTLPNEEFIGLHEPAFLGNEWTYLKDCIDTGWVSSVGKYVDRFELQLAETVNVRHAVAVVNGTAALHVCLMLVGVKPGDEVLIPALTFVATANAVTYTGAIPHFVDSEEHTLGLDPLKLEAYLEASAELRNGECFNRRTGRRIKAVVPMHTFGHPVDMDLLVSLCERFHLELVEDAAESLGSYYKGRHTGNWGKLSALSFNGNKILTTGGGGAILTNDPTLAKLAKHMTTTAKLPHQWAFNHDMVAYNYRMPNLNAALGCAQLEQLEAFLAQKRLLAERYVEAFASVDGVRFFQEPDFARSNYWLNVLLLNDPADRDAVLEATNRNGLMTRPAWTLMHRLSMFTDCPKMDLAVAENLAERMVNIPSSTRLGRSHA